MHDLRARDLSEQDQARHPPDTVGGVTRPLDFTLRDHSGAAFRLADALRERTVVLVFYRGDW